MAEILRWMIRIILRALWWPFDAIVLEPFRALGRALDRAVRRIAPLVLVTAVVGLTVKFGSPELHKEILAILSPLLTLFLTLGFVFLGFRIILHGLFGGRGRNRRGRG